MTAPFRHCPIEAVIFISTAPCLIQPRKSLLQSRCYFVRVALRHFTRERSRTTSVGGSRKLIKLASASLPGAINLIGALAERELRLGIS